MSGRAKAVALACVALLGGCSGGQTDLDKWIAETKAKPGGRIEPLPEVKPYETFTYTAGNLRSPFTPQGPTSGQASLRPSTRRNREFLEGFSLDTLRMVGTFKVGPNFYGLVQPGNYIGQNDGKITDITNGRISITEIVPDGLGGYIERPASLALAD